MAMSGISALRRSAFLALLACAALADPAAPASPWHVLPCWGGGYVQNAVFCPSDPSRMYLYVDVGGPYCSDDAGASWRPLHASMPVAMRDRGFDNVRSLSVDPRNADSVVILAGRDGDTPGGFAVTRDGGATWRVTGDAFAYGNSPKRPDGFCLSRSPFDPDELVGGEDRSGIFVSRDNGETWTNTGPEGVFFTDIRHDATVQGRVYASAPRIDPERMASWWILGESRKTPRGFGFFRSDDGARSWQRISDESPSEIAQIPGERRIIGLFDRHQHVRVSDDGGESWRPFEDGLLINDEPRHEPWADGNYYALAAGRDFWLIGDGNGNKFRRWRDDDAWHPLSDGLMLAGDPANEPQLAGRSPDEIRMTALMTLVTDPRDDQHWLATDWFELWETFDGGGTWTTRMKGVMPLVSYDIAFDPNSADNIMCCLNDVGAFVSHDGGRTFRRARAAAPSGDRRLPNNVATALYLKGSPGVVLCAGARGFDTGLWRSFDAGDTWEPLPGTGLPPLVPGESAASCLVQDPLDGSVLLTMSGLPKEGGGGVYRSRDGGVSWTWEGEGLADATGFDYYINHSQGAWPPLVVSPDGSMVTAARRGEEVALSRGAGKTAWKKSGLAQPDWRKYPLAADPFVPGRFLCGGRDMPVMESTDGGRSWHDYRPLEGMSCGGIAFDHEVPGSVVFGCHDGLYVSADGGATLRRIEGGLDVPSGRSRVIALDRGRLFFLTGGSGVWMRESGQGKR